MMGILGIVVLIILFEVNLICVRYYWVGMVNVEWGLLVNRVDLVVDWLIFVV